MGIATISDGMFRTSKENEEFVDYDRMNNDPTNYENLTEEKYKAVNLFFTDDNGNKSKDYGLGRDGKIYFRENNSLKQYSINEEKQTLMKQARLALKMTRKVLAVRQIYLKVMLRS